MVKIVLDSNFLGRGDLNLERLVKLRRKLIATDPTFIVPEVVVWEWAEHAHRSMASASEALGHLRSARRFVPCLPERFEVPDKESLISAMEVALAEEQIVVERHHGGDYEAAVRAQVLQVDGGERKKSGKREVKTGAADRLVVSAAEVAVQQHPGELVLLASGDKGVADFCSKHAPVVQVVRNENDLLEAVVSQVSSEEERRARSNVEKHVRNSLTIGLDDFAMQVNGLDRGYDVVARGGGGGAEWAYLGYLVADVHEVDLLKFALLQGRLATMLVGIEATMAITEYQPVVVSEDGDVDLEYNDRWSGRMHVEVPAFAVLSDDLTIESIEVSGRATVR